MYCIRDRKTDKLLGVSFTEEGLKYIANNMGEVLLFRRARFSIKENKVVLTGDLRPNPNVYVTKYEKLYHRNAFLDKIETFWEKAIDLKANYPNYYRIKSNVKLRTAID